MHWFYVFVILFSLQSVANEFRIEKAEQITEEWLIQEGSKTGYTDHIPHFKQIFHKMNVRTLIEFGVGFSTKYFLDHAQRVMSVELLTDGIGLDWIMDCIELYKDFKHWMPIGFFSGQEFQYRNRTYRYGLDLNIIPYRYIGINSVREAAIYQPAHYQSYALIDPSYLYDMNTFIEHLVESDGEVDVAFVDAGLCLRGDLVQLLFHKVPVILAHDIGPLEFRLFNDVYGYGRIQVPENYQEIYVPCGMGTCIWVKKEAPYFSIIEDLEKYAQSYTN